MKIAVEGCCHGALDEIYETIEQIEQRDKIKVDLLLICGDFQAIRNKTDFHAMAVPMQHKKLNTFYKYYSGEKEAPVLTIFIGGNHEASNYLQQLPYGGWVAKNIYYMGYAGVLNFGGVRIAGVSGIHKGVDYYKGHFERPPYDANSIRSCYHTRELEIYRLKQIKEPVDIMLSHDWPCGIYNYGNVNQLLRKKKFFQDEVKSNTLGSKPLEELLYEMQPKYWFAAHLHVKFAAKVQHSESGDKITKFLSLDKCLPFRQFLQVVDFPNESPKVPSLSLDPEWLCILKATNHLLNLQKYNSYIARNRSHGKSHVATEEQKKIIEEDFQGNFTIPPPGEFDETKVFNPTKENAKGYKAPLPQIEINPQTELLITMLDITDPFSVFSGIQKHSMEELDLSVVDNSKCEDSAIMDDGTTSDVDDRESSTFIDSSLDHTTDGTFNTTSNPDEISLSDDEEDAASSADQDVINNSNSSHCASENVELNDSSSVSKMCESFSLQVPISNTGETQELELSINKNNLQGSSTPIISQKPRSHSNLSPLILQPLEGSPVVASTPVHKLQKRSSPSLNDSIGSETESTDAGGNSSQSDSPVKPKKFKRRNQSMYSSADEN